MSQPRDSIGRFSGKSASKPSGGLGSHPPAQHRPTANPEYAAAMRELRRSSAAQPHDPRPNRQRSRKSARDAAIRDQKEG